MISLVEAGFGQINESSGCNGAYSSGHQILGTSHIVHFTEFIPMAIAGIALRERPTLMPRDDALIALTTGTILP